MFQWIKNKKLWRWEKNGGKWAEKSISWANYLLGHESAGCCSFLLCVGWPMGRTITIDFLRGADKSMNSLLATSWKRLVRNVWLVMDRLIGTSCFLGVKSVRVGTWWEGIKRIWKSQNPNFKWSNRKEWIIWALKPAEGLMQKVGRELTSISIFYLEAFSLNLRNINVR